MIYLCTVCDKNYILKGLTLYKSLKETIQEDFKLYWLCLDAITYESLKRINLPNIELTMLRTLEFSDVITFQKVKTLPLTNYGDAWANYCWRLTPYYINHVLNKFIPPGEKLLYVDSDIYFYFSPQLILNAIGEKPVGIHTHRFGRPYDDNQDTGWYNVGVVAFTAGDKGKEVAKAWMNWVFNPKDPLYEKYGTCGDQKWLNLFIPTFGRDNICVFDEEADIGHLAPWNFSNVDYPRPLYIIYQGKEQPVVFFHFSHFRLNEAGDHWHDSLHGEWNPASHPNIRQYYENYYQAMQSMIL